MFIRFCGRVSRPGHTCLQVALCCYNKSLWLLPQALAITHSAGEHLRTPPTHPCSQGSFLRTAPQWGPAQT